MIEHITNLLKSSITFLMGFTFGIIASLIGLTPFLSIAIFGIPLFAPLILMVIFVGFFTIIFFKKDRIEEIKSQEVMQ